MTDFIEAGSLRIRNVGFDRSTQHGDAHGGFGLAALIGPPIKSTILNERLDVTREHHFIAWLDLVNVTDLHVWIIDFLADHGLPQILAIQITKRIGPIGDMLGQLVGGDFWIQSKEGLKHIDAIA